MEGSEQRQGCCEMQLQVVTLPLQWDWTFSELTPRTPRQRVVCQLFFNQEYGLLLLQGFSISVTGIPLAIPFLFLFFI